MAPSRTLPTRPSLASLRKQAKKLQRELAAREPDAVARVRALLPDATPPLTQRAAQLVLAREYGFAGCKELRAEVLKRTGHGLAWAAREAERAIHEDDLGRLEQLLAQHPALLQYRDASGAPLLTLAAAAFGVTGDAGREQTFTRRACAELLIERGAAADSALWENVVTMRSAGMLQLLSSKGLLPRTLRVLAALGDLEGVHAHVGAADRVERSQACMDACAFGHAEIATLLLECCLELDPELGRRVDAGPGRRAFLAYLHEHHDRFEAQGDLWRSFVMSQMRSAIDASDAAALTGLLQREAWLMGEPCLDAPVHLLEYATFTGREDCLRALLDARPALLDHRPAPRSAALEYAFEYGHAAYVPLLARIWDVPDDLPHAAGQGDLERVKRWFDADGRVSLGDPTRHYPLHDPRKLEHLHWSAGEVQHVLDSALAWACLNHHFAVADFLLDHGADIDTDWGTHEPASILHECALQGNRAAAEFLIERGIDLSLEDHRWGATAEGWARHAAEDDAMARLLADARKARSAAP